MNNEQPQNMKLSTKVQTKQLIEWSLKLYVRFYVFFQNTKGLLRFLKLLRTFFRTLLLGLHFYLGLCFGLEGFTSAPP